MTSKEYLGDAVYADLREVHAILTMIDGDKEPKTVAFSESSVVVLTTTDGIRDTNTIFLNPSVLAALLSWLRRLGVSMDV